MERVRQGTAGFADFVRANTSSLLRTGYLLTGSHAAAEELVQDTLVQLYPKWDKVAAAELPLAYVRRSLTNRFINGTRRASYREALLEFVPDRGDGRDDVTLLVEREALWSLLRTLPDRQRAALVLRFFHDLPDDEIATALSCRAGTVRSLISRGLATLREQADSADAPASPTRSRRLR